MINKNRVEELRKNIKDGEERLGYYKDLLREIENDCSHQWSDAERDDIIHPAGSHPGDPVGTMEVDWRGPTSWREERIPRWKRICIICGMKQYTTESKIDTVKPVFQEKHNESYRFV